MRRLEIAQGIHLRLQIVRPQACDLLTKFVTQQVFVRRGVKASPIQKLIKQYRGSGYLLGDPGTGAAQRHQINKGGRIFEQHDKIGTATHDRGDQRQNSLQR